MVASCLKRVEENLQSGVKDILSFIELEPFLPCNSIVILHFLCVLLLEFIVYLAGKHGVSNESMQYKPLGAEMLHLDHAQFTLDSEDDGDDNVKHEGKVLVEKKLDLVQERTVEVKPNSKAPVTVTPCAGYSLIPWEGNKLISIVGHLKNPSEVVNGI
ncbi:unnamed protein product [Lactuca virosa]|uniref:Uncharacterized protein n=1 Tax=Lactuca virosa TaxID=75947 RepID=A0AAU9P1T6_9ASTR|nr:unnamed protein product [Lactuca virosa]